MRWLLLLLLSTGCRQLLGIEGAEIEDDASITPIDEMDVPPDERPIGAHDEDGDGVPDTTDNCPTVANTNQAATPADELVGSACDPRVDPGGGGDRIAAFFSFAADGRPAELMGGNLFQMDHAMFSGGELSTQMQHTPTRVSIVVSNTTIPSSSNAYIELRLGNYTCRVGPCSGSGVLCLQANGEDITSETDVTVEPTVRFELDQLGGDVRCRVVGATTTTITMIDANVVDTDRARIRSNGVSLTIDSFIIYAAP